MISYRSRLEIGIISHAARLLIVSKYLSISVTLDIKHVQNKDQ